MAGSPSPEIWIYHTGVNGCLNCRAEIVGLPNIHSTRLGYSMADSHCAEPELKLYNVGSVQLGGKDRLSCLVPRATWLPAGPCAASQGGLTLQHGNNAKAAVVGTELP